MRKYEIALTDKYVTVVDWITIGCIVLVATLVMVSVGNAITSSLLQV